MVYQIELHPRLPQRELRKIHPRRRIATDAWSPLSKGSLLVHQTITAVAEKRPQLLIGWHMQLGNIVIPKQVNPSRIASNFDVSEFKLSAAEMASISSIDDRTRLERNPCTFDFTGR